MHCYSFIRIVSKSKSLPVYIQRRYRYKRQWALKEKTRTSPCELALKHFDLHYKPVYDLQWPSVRVSLLSKSKYCALINNFASDSKRIAMTLAELGAHDFIWTARDKFVDKQLRDAGRDTNTAGTEELNSTDDSHVGDNRLDSDAEDAMVDAVGYDNECETTAGAAVAADYMPVRRIVSDKEQLKHQELFQSEFSPSPAVPVTTVPRTIYCIPLHLTAYAYDLGDISLFPTPKKDDTNKLGYYPMDGSSVLPVIALDVEPGCHVLDLCAAPGGKSLTILQTLLPDHLTCVDESKSRLRRLRNTIESYLPKSYLDDSKVRIVHGDAATFVTDEEARGHSFDRVLVDVPCYTDRHVVIEEENNLFHTNRIAERLHLPDRQQQLLYAGIRACRPGGIVVYSTCTLSPVQNDGVVAATLERVWYNTGIEVVVEDIRTSMNCFTPMFKFFDGCRYGNLVLPSLLSNFGPMYFSRIRRIS